MKLSEKHYSLLHFDGKFECANEALQEKNVLTTYFLQFTQLVPLKQIFSINLGFTYLSFARVLTVKWSTTWSADIYGI